MSDHQPFVINIAKEIGSTRYNGGWTKTITGINKMVSSGFSLLGEFIKGGLFPCLPGLYLDCGMGGSRKNVTHHYTLVEVTDTGEVEVIATVEGLSGYSRGKTGGDWAVQLWEPIEDYFLRQLQAVCDEIKPVRRIHLTVSLSESLSDHTQCVVVSVEESDMPTVFWHGQTRYEENKAAMADVGEIADALQYALKSVGFTRIEEA